MSAIATYRMMSDYNRWMNQRLYAAAAQLPDAERKRDRGAFFKSLHGTLNHLLVADHLWMGRFDNTPFEWRGHAHELFSDFDALKGAREAMDDRIAAFVACLTPEWIAAPLDYPKTSGARVRVAGHVALTHFFNHQTHHRGQATTLLMQAGIDPGATDIVAMPGIQAPAG